MFPTICDCLLNTNTLIIGDRNCGKTTFLKQVINFAMEIGYRIIVFDSATDHVNKSILIYCKRLFSNYLEIKSPEKEVIDSWNGGTPFPYDLLNEKRSTIIYLFDVSRYLEEGFLYEADDPRRNTIRMLYKKLVIQCLAVMYDFLPSSKYIVIMDEIEFIPDFVNEIIKYNERGIHFINCLHTEDSCDEKITRLFEIWHLKDVFSCQLGIISEKEESMLCGPACLHYLLNIILKKKVIIPPDYVWIADIAKFLSDLRINHELSCYDSILYNNYIKGYLPQNHPGHLSIRNYLATNNKILIRKFSESDILYNRSPNSYFIASVKSVFLDKTSPKDSYHFILVHQTMDMFAIICPRKKDYCRMSMETDYFVRMINKSGNWILKIQL